MGTDITITANVLDKKEFDILKKAFNAHRFDKNSGVEYEYKKGMFSYHGKCKSNPIKKKFLFWEYDAHESACDEGKEIDEISKEFPNIEFTFESSDMDGTSIIKAGKAKFTAYP